MCVWYGKVGQSFGWKIFPDSSLEPIGALLVSRFAIVPYWRVCKQQQQQQQTDSAFRYPGSGWLSGLWRMLFEI